MFEIGQTSGVTTCKKDPCKSICSYLSKMAKTAEDLPCPHVAATKVVEVAQGTFCKGKCLKSATYSVDSGGGGSGCCGGSSCSGSGGCCGKSCGGKSSPSSQSSPSSVNNTGSGSSDGNGGTTSNTSPSGTNGAGTTNSETGAAYTKDQETADAINFAVEHALDVMQLADTGIQIARDPIQATRVWTRPVTNRAKTLSPALIVPSAIDDILNSSYPEVIQNRDAMASDFRRTMCQNRPYPECEACPYAYDNMPIDDTGLLEILQGIQQGLDAIARGDCAWGENMFNCPGQIRALLEQSLGPLGKILGPVAAGTMIAMTAAKGALHAHTNILRTYKHTDSAVQLKKSVGRAISSGGCPSSYAQMANGILKELDVETADLFTSGAMPGMDTGPIVKGSGRDSVANQTKEIPVIASPMTNSSPFTPAANQTGIRATPGSHSNATRAATSELPQGPSRFAKQQAKNVGALVSKPMLLAEKAVNDPYGTREAKKVRPLHRDTIVYPVYHVRAAVGGDYYYEKEEENPETGATVKGFRRIPTVANEELQPYRAKYGQIYSKPFARKKVSETNYPDQIETYIHTTDEVGEPGKEYYKLVPAGTSTYIRVPEKISDAVVAESILDKFIPVAEETLGYAILEKIKGGNYDHDEPPVIMQEDGTVVAVGPVVFDNGLMLEPPNSIDAVDFDAVVDTTKLVTKTHIMASEMAKLYGINLTEDEIRMAYLLDHEINGTTLPDDCLSGQRISTILDTLPDNEYD